MTKLVLILCAVNTIAILFLCWNAYMQIESSGQIIKSLNKELNQSENLIRYMFIKVKDHQELPTKLANEKK